MDQMTDPAGPGLGWTLSLTVYQLGTDCQKIMVGQFHSALGGMTLPT